MLCYDDARAQVTGAAWTLPIERVPLESALRRVLAEELRSDVDMPPFNKASMDGYACRAADAFQPLRVIEHVGAGQVPEHPIARGTCSKVMTGAPVPEGADCILIVEEVRVDADGTVYFTGSEARSHICPAGEDVRTGDLVLAAGIRLQAQHLPALAAAGGATVGVYGRPRVGVLATGAELVPPASKPAAGQIRNSNSVQLVALARNAGGVALDLGIVPDNEAVMRAAWDEALETQDVVVSTGGVSMGDYDFVPAILRHHGFEIHFDRVGIQPGKPVLFGTRGRQACFGLSGNPVSSFLQFMLFVAPFLHRLQGADDDGRTVYLTLAETFSRRNTERMGWVPVRLDDAGRVRSIAFHGSAHINAFSVAAGVMAFPAGTGTLECGTTVPVRLLDV